MAGLILLGMMLYGVLVGFMLAFFYGATRPIVITKDDPQDTHTSQ